MDSEKAADILPDAQLTHPLLNVGGTHNIRKVFRVWTSLNSQQPDIKDYPIFDGYVAIIHLIQHLRPRFFPFFHFEIPSVTVLRLREDEDTGLLYIYKQEDNWTLEGLIQSVPIVNWWYEKVVRYIMGELITSAGDFLYTANTATSRLTDRAGEFRDTSNIAIEQGQIRARSMVNGLSDSVRSQLQIAHEEIESLAAQCIKQDPSNSEPCILFASLLTDNLSDTTKYSVKEQSELLDHIKNLIIPLDDGNGNHEKIELLKNISWDLFTLIAPYLSLDQSDITDIRFIISQEIINSIAQYNNPRETHLLILERFSWFDWNANGDNNSNNKKQQIALEFIGLAKALGIVLDKLDRKNIIKFLPDTISNFAKIWRIIIPELNDDNKINDSLIENCIKLTESISRFVDSNNKDLKLTSTPKDLSNQEYYLINYILMIAFENFIIYSTHIPMSSTYYEMFHPKYNIPWKSRQSEKIKSIDKIRLSRLLDASFKANISIDNLVNYFNNSTGSSEKYKDVNDDDNEGFSTKDFPISKEGTILYLASIIFYKFMPLDDDNDKNKPKKKEIPIAPEWLFKKICPLIISSLTSDENKSGMADKILLILIYLSERNEENMFTIGHLEAKLAKDGSNLFMVFQSVVSFASTSPNESLRFIAHQLIISLIGLCKEDAKMYLLNELLVNCPFESMKSAAIWMIKEIVAKNLDKAYNKENISRDENEKEFYSIFSSKLIVEGFFQNIFFFKFNDLENESDFFDKRSFIMNGLNFLLFLLIRDKNNLTGVWDSNLIDKISKEYLQPIENKYKHQNGDYENDENKINQKGDSSVIEIGLKIDEITNLNPLQEYQLLSQKLFDLYLLEDKTKRIQEILSNKNSI
nr:3593_t:CDS:10 [Entrophospora candida]